MSSRIQVHAETPVAGRLVLVSPCPLREDGWFRSVDVPHGEVEVELLRMLAARPSRDNPVVNALEGEGRRAIRVLRRHATSWRDERCPIPGRIGLKRPAEELPVKVCELACVRAVQNDQVQHRLHGRNLAAPERRQLGGAESDGVSRVLTASDAWVSSSGPDFAVASSSPPALARVVPGSISAIGTSRWLVSQPTSTTE